MGWPAIDSVRMLRTLLSLSDRPRAVLAASHEQGQWMAKHQGGGYGRQPRRTIFSVRLGGDYAEAPPAEVGRETGNADKPPRVCRPSRGELRGGGDPHSRLPVRRDGRVSLP